MQALCKRESRSKDTRDLPKAALLVLSAFLMILTAACVSPQPTQYETVANTVEVTRAPAGTKPVKIALIPFRDQTGNAYLVQPATSQLTSLMVQSGYFRIIEPSLIESIVKNQGAITPDKLQEIREKYGAEYFLTGNLTNFEIRETSSGTCLFFGILGSAQENKYIVETGIDYRLVDLTTLPNPRIVSADALENVRTDTSKSAGILFSQSGYSTRVKQSSGGKLLRYAMRDLVERLITDLQNKRK